MDGELVILIDMMERVSNHGSFPFSLTLTSSSHSQHKKYDDDDLDRRNHGSHFLPLRNKSPFNSSHGLMYPYIKSYYQQVHSNPFIETTILYVFVILAICMTSRNEVYDF
jgi:hypothetical protein